MIAGTQYYSINRIGESNIKTFFGIAKQHKAEIYLRIQNVRKKTLFYSNINILYLNY